MPVDGGGLELLHAVQQTRGQHTRVRLPLFALPELHSSQLICLFGTGLWTSRSEDGSEIERESACM